MGDTDPTAPWFEFLSYVRCCESLEVTPSIQKFMKYNEHFNECFNEKQKTN